MKVIIEHDATSPKIRCRIKGFMEFVAEKKLPDYIDFAKLALEYAKKGDAEVTVSTSRNSVKITFGK